MGAAAWVQALGWALVHFLWQGAALALLLAAALRAGRAWAPAVRYLLACACLVAMLAAPAVTFRRGLADAESARSTTGVVARTSSADASVDRTPSAAGTATGEEDVAVAPSRAAVPVLRRLASWAEGAVGFLLPWLVPLWMAGVGVLSLRLAGGWTYAQRLAERGVSAPSEAWAERFAELGRRMRVSAPVRLLVSTLVHVPTVVGWLRPVVLVPASAFTGLTPRQLELLLLHELAHVRRHDYLANLLQSAAEVLLFYHPAVWWVSRRIREEREHCCDDLAAGGDVREYIRALATMEEIRVRRPGLALAADGAPLLARALRLAEPPTAGAAAPRLAAALVALGLGAAALTLRDAPPHLASSPEAAPAPASSASLLCPVGVPGAEDTLCPALTERARALLAEHGTEGAVVVQDVATGAVLTYAAASDDPAAVQATTPLLPASVWKLVLATAWWDAGLPDETLPCPASLRVGERTFRNGGGADRVVVAPAEVLVHSCNTAAVGMALRLRAKDGRGAMAATLRRLGFPLTADGAAAPADSGFWATTSARFRREMSPAAPRVPLAADASPEAWGELALGTRGVRVTPLHVSRFMQAVGNDGTMLAPTVEPALAAAPRAGRAAMRPETARRIHAALRDAATRGTARAADRLLAGVDWKLGGKTGTAPGAGERADGWFAGLAFDPSGRPRYTVVVHLRGGGPGGGAPTELAAGLVRALAGDPPKVAMR